MIQEGGIDGQVIFLQFSTGTFKVMHAYSKVTLIPVSAFCFSFISECTERTIGCLDRLVFQHVTTTNILIFCAVVVYRSCVWSADHPCCGLKWHQQLLDEDVHRVLTVYQHVCYLQSTCSAHRISRTLNKRTFLLVEEFQ